MIQKNYLSLISSICLILGGSLSYAQTPLTLTVRADRPQHDIPRSLYGIFFEDINYAADGGLYPELIANRGFDWRTREPESWSREWRGAAMGRISLQGAEPLHPNTFQYLRIECYTPGEGAGVINHGFGGIAVHQEEAYRLSFYARRHAGYSGGLTVLLETPKGEVLASHRIAPDAWQTELPRVPAAKSPLAHDVMAAWAKYETTWRPSATEPQARLVILLDARGTVDLELVSLFPQATYKERPNGLRKDLMEMLAALRPATLRFPGGCLVEGNNFETMYHWKRTVGSLEQRALNFNIWGYWQTHGLGYYEYFQMAEDLGAEPLPILAAGLSCQFRQPEFLPVDALDLVVQDALDLIEFANGTPESDWGRVRAQMGHPASFNLKYLGIGNENWGTDFLERYAVIAKAIKAHHPEITVISSAGASPSGAMFDLAWRTLPGMQAELVDEHYYQSPEWFLAQAGRYDFYDRQGPKVYVGEYACHTHDRKNNLLAALCEAAMMTGFERNSDIVSMTAYAPLFNKVGNTQWNINLIWFDNTRVFGTPSYYVQKLFMRNLPDVVLPLEITGDPQVKDVQGTIGLHTWQTAAEFKELRVTHGDALLYTSEGATDLADWSKAREGSWSCADGTLKQADATKNNTAITLARGAQWHDYTLELKARKLSGKEGFIIRFREHDGSCVHVNLGGWDNQQHGLERGPLARLTRRPGTIETGRWYDIKISLDGEQVMVWLDGALLFDQRVPQQVKASLYGVAGLDKTANQVVIKAVNPFATEQAAHLALQGVKAAAQPVQRFLLTGAPESVNTLEQPEQVVPQSDTLEFDGNQLRWVLPPYSLSVLRVPLAAAP